MENNQELEPIDLMRYLRRFLKVLRWTWLPILVLSILYGGLQYARSYRSYTPYYKTSALMTVNTGLNSNDIFNNDTYYDTAAVEDVVQTLPTLLNTDFMRDLITAELGLGYIPGSISVEAIPNTTFFQLSVTGSDPKQIYDVLNAVIDAYPKAAVYMTDNTALVIVDAPTVPTTPANSRSTISAGTLARSIAKVMIIGLALTLGVSLLKQTVGSDQELKEMVSIPLLACLPQIQMKQRRKHTEILIRAEDDPCMEEAVRGLRTKVRKALDSRGGKTILLTSTIPGEGKTTAAINLAMSLAQDGHRTLLLDADLRNQTVSRLLGDIRQCKGLMAMLNTPDLPLNRFVQKMEGCGLHFISGESITKRHYRIDPKALDRVLKELTAQYDYVVVDTPPCSVVSDTALLSRHAECVLYVVRQDYANKAQILDSVMGLHHQDVPVTGCILNGATRTRRSYGYGYGSKYGYGEKRGYGRMRE